MHDPRKPGGPRDRGTRPGAGAGYFHDDFNRISVPGDFNDNHSDGCCDLDYLLDDNVYGNVDSPYVDRDIQHNEVRIHGYGVIRDGGFGDIDGLRGNNNCDKHCCVNDLQHDGDSDPDCYRVDDGFDRYCCRYDEDDRHDDRPEHIYDLVNSDGNHDRTDRDSYRNGNPDHARNNNRNDNKHLYRDGSYPAHSPADSWLPI